MNLAHAEKIAKAVLYEGYMLYPYRPSSIKNQRRFNFGVVYPEACSRECKHLEPCVLQTECLLQAGEDARLQPCLRFLRMVDRSVGKFAAETLSAVSEQDIEPVTSLEVDGRVFQPWQEVEEQEIQHPALLVGDLKHGPWTHWFELPAKQTVERIHDTEGNLAGAVVRKCEGLQGSVSISAERLRDGVFKLRLRVANESDCAVCEATACDDVLPNSLLSAHLVLGIEKGAFVSLLDPPPDLQTFASACHSSGLWPVLVGESGTSDTLLCSPIILYDYPQIAPESPGDLFDATEIDEILSLRILTLTDEEKREMRTSDERARAILERTESLSPEHWSRLHGAVRSLQPLKEKAS